MEIKEWMRKFTNIGDDWDIDSVQFEDDPLHIDIHISYSGELKCPVCSKHCSQYDGRTRIWREVNLNNAIVNIIATFPRVKCPKHNVHEIDIPWAGKVSRLTLKFEEECIRYAMVMPVSLASGLLNVNDDTIWRIVKHASDMVMRDLDLSEMKEFCIDETKSKLGQDYITVVTWPKRHLVIFCTHGKDISTMCELNDWLIHHKCNPKQIETISCDMSRSYIKGCEFFFPNATIVFDRFHVENAANVMIDDVRKSSGLKSAIAKGLRFKLLTKKEKLNEDDVVKIDSVFDLYRDLSLAYSIKESLGDFYRIKDTNHAAVYLNLIINSANNSNIDRIVKFGETLENHFDGIVSWHSKNISNGVAEGFNSSIQAMKSMARGYGNVENMISLIYLKNCKKKCNPQ